MTRVMRTPLDARGVEIVAGDRVIYGFGTGRSVAMAEGEVMQAAAGVEGEPSITATGLVRIRVIRRSYHNKTKPVVSIGPDRIVVLKPVRPGAVDYVLPFSPQPTQDEINYDELTAALESGVENIERLESGGELEPYEYRSGSYSNPTEDRSPERRSAWLSHYREAVHRDWEALGRVCQRLRRAMPSGLEEHP